MAVDEDETVLLVYRGVGTYPGDDVGECIGEVAGDALRSVGLVSGDVAREDAWLLYRGSETDGEIGEVGRESDAVLAPALPNDVALELAGMLSVAAAALIL